MENSKNIHKMIFDAKDENRLISQIHHDQKFTNYIKIEENMVFEEYDGFEYSRVYFHILDGKKKLFHSQNEELVAENGYLYTFRKEEEKYYISYHNHKFQAWKGDYHAVFLKYRTKYTELKDENAKLNNKILEVKSSRQDLVELIKTLDNAISRTNKNIAELKTMSASSTNELQVYVEKARELIGDLSFMTDTASSLADRIEKGMNNVKKNGDESDIKKLSENIDKMLGKISNENAINVNNEDSLANQGRSFQKTRGSLLEAFRSKRGF
jgi:uncharacterized coiled-coil DUF342 family protein